MKNTRSEPKKNKKQQSPIPLLSPRLTKTAVPKEENRQQTQLDENLSKYYSYRKITGTLNCTNCIYAVRGVKTNEKRTHVISGEL